MSTSVLIQIGFKIQKVTEDVRVCHPSSLVLVHGLQEVVDLQNYVQQNLHIRLQQYRHIHVVELSWCGSGWLSVS